MASVFPSSRPLSIAIQVPTGASLTSRAKDRVRGTWPSDVVTSPGEMRDVSKHLDVLTVGPP